jgi:DnaK suppressor protein
MAKTTVKKAEAKSVKKKTTKAKVNKSACKTTEKKCATASPKKKSVTAAEKKTTVKKKTTTETKTANAAKKKAPTKSQRAKVIEHIKQDLLSQRNSLLKEAEETLSSLPGEINFPDMGDQATAETDRNFILRLRDRERMLLKKIEETIERLDSPDYGTCEECGNEIGIKRLEARPVTTYCIDCKTRQEEEERIAEG